MFSVSTDYTRPTMPQTGYAQSNLPSTGWGVEARHTYGAEAGTTTRIHYGDHVRYGGLNKVSYKFINTNYTT
jgi:hypothetical protein